METRQQRLIRQALEHGEKRAQEPAMPEATLRDKSLQHTADDYLPKTLTPHEWEQYYRDHGVPAAHHAPRPRKDDKERSWWTRLRRSFGRLL